MNPDFRFKEKFFLTAYYALAVVLGLAITLWSLLSYSKLQSQLKTLKSKKIAHNPQTFFLGTLSVSDSPYNQTKVRLNASGQSPEVLPKISNRKKYTPSMLPRLPGPALKS